MNLRRLHRRLAVLMSLAGLVAFAGGAGFEPVSAFLAAIALTTALFWHPDRALSTRLERIWLPLATVLVVRALAHVLFIRDDIVIPVVDLLLLLLAAESLRSLDAPNDLRLYALSFALILASTAYRPGIVFLLAFIAYVVLATLALMVGHVRRRAEKYHVREVPLGRGLLATTGVLSGVVFMVAAFVFVTFPRVSRGWAGRGEQLATSIAGFSDEISIGQYGSTILGNPEIVLRVEFPDGAPSDLSSLHWHGRSYDHFDGVRWTRTEQIPPSSAPRQWYRDRWSQDVLQYKIFGAPLDVRVLFALYPVLDIDSENGIQPLFDNAGDYVYWGSGAPVYTVSSPVAPPPPEALRTASRGFTPSADHYLQLPTIDERIRALADSLTRDYDNRYDRVVAIRDWLRTFEYTRDLPATSEEATLEHFLFERQAGHCEYFSTAMVVMLRSIGIQARNVNGFLGGQWSQFGDYLAVTQNAAHSWVEVWFQGYGWVTFDPTPAGAAEGEALTSWFWPGRILFDGLQHRWSKWVLDYGTDEQAGVFAGLFSQDPEADASDSSSAGTSLVRLLGGALLVMMLLGGFAWAQRGTPRKKATPAMRMYLQLRAACTRAGLGVLSGTTPLALVDRVRADRASAARPAERVVDLYLRSRYGGQSLADSELREMREALGAARRMLRARV
ncbi:MAG: transglutaminaseTgpA domain-containing protein [Gemmatimonadota bacterium]|jgi:transglutaminase-like putative cysteine protease